MSRIKLLVGKPLQTTATMTALESMELDVELIQLATEGQNIAKDIENDNHILNDVFRNVNCLESIQDAMSTSVQSGTKLTYVSLNIIGLSLESIYSDLGITKPKEFTEFHSTEIAVEGVFSSIGNALLAVWNGIKNFFKMIFNKIMQFFGWITGSTRADERRQAQVEEDIEYAKQRKENNAAYEKSNAEYKERQEARDEREAENKRKNDEWTKNYEAEKKAREDKKKKDSEDFNERQKQWDKASDQFNKEQDDMKREREERESKNGEKEERDAEREAYRKKRDKEWEDGREERWKKYSSDWRNNGSTNGSSYSSSNDIKDGISSVGLEKLHVDGHINFESVSVIIENLLILTTDNKKIPEYVVEFDNEIIKEIEIIKKELLAKGSEEANKEVLKNKIFDIETLRKNKAANFISDQIEKTKQHKKDGSSMSSGPIGGGKCMVIAATHDGAVFDLSITDIGNRFTNKAKDKAKKLDISEAEKLKAEIDRLITVKKKTNSLYNKIQNHYGEMDKVSDEIIQIITTNLKGDTGSGEYMRKRFSNIKELIKVNNTYITIGIVQITSMVSTVISESQRYIQLSIGTHKEAEAA